LLEKFLLLMKGDLTIGKKKSPRLFLRFFGFDFKGKVKIRSRLWSDSSVIYFKVI